jgi:hypothetical protein
MLDTIVLTEGYFAAMASGRVAFTLPQMGSASRASGRFEVGNRLVDFLQPTGL